MTCTKKKKKKKTKISVITAPCANYPSADSACNRHRLRERPRKGASPAQAAVEGQQMGPTFLPSLSSGCRPRIEPSPQPRLWGTHISKPGTSSKLQEVQKNKRPGDSHSVKGSPRHLKRKLGFPQCRFRGMGGGAQLRLWSWVAERDSQFNPGYESFGANSGPRQADPAAAPLLAG